MNTQEVRASFDLVNLRAWDRTRGLYKAVVDCLVFVSVAEESGNCDLIEGNSYLPFGCRVSNDGVEVVWITGVSRPSLEQAGKLCDDCWVLSGSRGPLLELFFSVVCLLLEHGLEKGFRVLEGVRDAHSAHETRAHDELVRASSHLLHVWVSIVACNGSFRDESLALIWMADSKLEHGWATTRCAMDCTLLDTQAV